MKTLSALLTLVGIFSISAQSFAIAPPNCSDGGSLYYVVVNSRNSIVFSDNRTGRKVKLTADSINNLSGEPMNRGEYNVCANVGPNAATILYVQDVTGGLE